MRKYIEQFELPMSTSVTGKPNKYEPAYTDTDLMPWGKYKGEPLQDIPASYLAWLYNDMDEALKLYVGAKSVRNVPLANYIYNSRNAINQELGSEIIKHP